MNSYKVIIAGGGPAGTLTAISLIRSRPELAGQVLVLEGKRYPRDKVCGGGVAGRVVRSLRDAGVSLDALPHRRARGLTLDYGRHRSFTSFGGQDAYVLRRADLDQYLMECALELGVHARDGAPVTGAFRDLRGVTVMTREGTLYRGQVLVGADGVNGASRSWFGMPARNERQLLLQGWLPTPGAGPTEESILLDFTPVKLGGRGYCWFFPSIGPDGEPALNTGVTGGRFARGEGRRLLDMYHRIIARHPQIAGLARRHPPKLRPYPERVLSWMQKFAGMRVIFVGEQLGVDPLTGEGLGVCIDSAATAAAEISKALDDGDFSFSRYRARMLRTGSFNLWTAGRFFTLAQTDFRFSTVLKVITAELDGMVNYMDNYCRVFSGVQEPASLYHSGNMKAVVRGLRTMMGPQ